jgi:hypothetical protein
MRFFTQSHPLPVADRAPRHGQAVVWLQTGCILVGFALMAFMPPPSGRMILLPLGMQSHGEMIALAIAHGAAPIGYGPIAGSMVVDGPRDGLMTAMLARGILPIAAPAAGCGNSTPPGRTRAGAPS